MPTSPTPAARCPHPPPLLEHGGPETSLADSQPRPAPRARNPTPRPAGLPGGAPFDHETTRRPDPRPSERRPRRARQPGPADRPTAAALTLFL